MSHDASADGATAKHDLRRRILAVRDALPDRAAASRAILERLRGLDVWARAATICCYVGIRSEVETRPLLADALAEGRRVVVPACVGATLRLVQLASLDELVPARFGLLEPGEPLCRAVERACPVEAVDLFVVPGVAFDRTGGRIGYGRGFYDRLLAGARAEAPRVGLAYEAQLVERVPTEPTDLPMDLVITERAVYVRALSGRSADAPSAGQAAESRDASASS